VLCISQRSYRRKAGRERHRDRELTSYPILSPHTTRPSTLMRARSAGSVLATFHQKVKALMDTDTDLVNSSQYLEGDCTRVTKTEQLELESIFGQVNQSSRSRSKYEEGSRATTPSKDGRGIPRSQTQSDHTREGNTRRSKVTCPASGAH
jgi:hypothetical protein